MDQSTVDETRPSLTANIIYAVETRLSRFTVQAFAGGILSAIGHSPVLAIRDFSGEIHLAPETMERSSMHLTIKADSLAVTSDSSDKDRREIEKTMNTEVLETSRYPEISFDTKSVSASEAGEGFYLASLNGDLTLHGITRQVTVPARLNVTGEMLRASGDFAIKQSDFGIKLVSVAGGVIKIKDQLKFNFDIVARKHG